MLFYIVFQGVRFGKMSTCGEGQRMSNRQIEIKVTMCMGK